MSRVPLRPHLHPDDHQLAVGGQQVDMIIQVLPPMLWDHVDTMITRGRAYGGHPVFAIGDRVVGAESSAVVQLLRGARSGDHRGAEVLGHGMAKEPIPQRRRAQQGLTGRQVGVGQVGLHRRRCLDHSAGGQQIDPGWRMPPVRPGPRRVRRTRRRRSARRTRRRPPSRTPPARARRYGPTPPAEDSAGPWGRRVVALSLEEVGPVHPTHAPDRDLI